MEDTYKYVQTLRDRYEATARKIALKKSLLTESHKLTSSERNWYITTLFLTVVLLAGALTGFGAAAPIISAILSLFTFVNVQVGYLALGVFALYSIPWALVYIPEVGNIFRNYWESYFGLNSKNAPPLYHGPALEKAHQILEMLYRKSLNNVLKDKLTQEQITQQLEKYPPDYIKEVGKLLERLSVYNAIEHAMVNNLTHKPDEGQSLVNTIIQHAMQSEYATLGHQLFFTEPSAESATVLKSTAQQTTRSAEENEAFAAYLKRQLAKIISGRKIEEGEDNLETYFSELKAHDSINDFIPFDALKTKRSALLSKTNETDQLDSFAKTQAKMTSQWLWQLLKRASKRHSKWIMIAESIGYFLGFFNAAIANTTGTALAPLYIISTMMMIYGVPNALIPMPLAVILVGMFALSGFIASYGITRKSIERVFSDIANFFLDTDRANRKHKQWIKPSTVLYSVMALLLAVSIASFNFLAGVTFGHILINPILLTQPTYIASFSITSFAALHPIEIALGSIGFGFTVIAVAPLMLGAWNSFLKANTAEPFWTKPIISIAAFLTSAINTALLVRMLLRPGSPLTLFFGQAPWVISGMTILAPICIFILGFALFYMGLKSLISTRGRDYDTIYDEIFALEPAFIFKPNTDEIPNMGDLYDNDTGPENTPENPYNIGP